MSTFLMIVLILVGIVFVSAVIYVSLHAKLSEDVTGNVQRNLVKALRSIESKVNDDPPSVIDGMRKLSSAKLDRLITDRNKPLHLIESFPDDLRHLLAPLTYEKVTELLLNAAKDDKDEEQDILRVITVMAARRNSPIPIKLVVLDDRTLDFYQMLNFEQQLVLVSKEDIYFHPTDTAEIDPSIDLRYCSSFFNDIATICTRSQMQNNFPLLEKLHCRIAKDRRQPMYGRLSPDVTGAMATIYSAITGMKIPQTYVRYGLLTHELMKIVDVKSRPTLRVIRNNQVESNDGQD